MSSALIVSLGADGTSSGPQCDQDFPGFFIRAPGQEHYFVCSRTQFLHDRSVRIRAGWKHCDTVRPSRECVCVCVGGGVKVQLWLRLLLGVSGVQEASTVAAVSSPANRHPATERLRPHSYD